MILEPILLPNVLIRGQVLEYKARATAEWRAVVAVARAAAARERGEEEAERGDAEMDLRRRVSRGGAEGEEEEGKACPMVGEEGKTCA